MKTCFGTEIKFYHIGLGELCRLQQEWMVESLLIPTWELSEEKAMEFATSAEAMFKSVSNQPYSVFMYYKDQSSNSNNPPLWEDIRTICVLSEEEVKEGELAAVYFDVPRCRNRNSNQDLPELVTWHFCKNPTTKMSPLQSAEFRAEVAEARIKELEAALLVGNHD